ncbi:MULTISPECIES: DUF1127 domain-containing protein [Marinobacter]|uniref:DUF1127 domain-containing protein n=1 Tax=Marinobacter TaxID=2742 RepID=UPI001402BBF2|nr:MULTISPECIES: hypothetical protein [Marinobacter]
MKSVFSVFNKWKKKRDFAYMVGRMDERLLLDVGYSRAEAEERLSTPFWKFH